MQWVDPDVSRFSLLSVGPAKRRQGERLFELKVLANKNDAALMAEIMRQIDELIVVLEDHLVHCQLRVGRGIGLPRSGHAAIRQALINFAQKY